MNVVRLRLKMSDWVKTEIEEYVINRLAELHKIHQFTTFVFDTVSSISFNNNNLSLPGLFT